jgi:conjugative relaxase-like TrwC/TraI family protein
MLRINQNSSASHAKSYYPTPDYYIDGAKDQELPGIWRGKGAERLGLAGVIDQTAWDALCENRDPNTDLPLTVRNKSDRTVGMDFNFHVPKTVSVLYAMTRDDRIVDALRDSVRETMNEIETRMQTRVRRNRADENRTTGNMLWGEFIHLTSRPVGGIPDPHLHVHCFVHNATFDDKEQRWKAGQFRELKRHAPYFEAKFHSKLAWKFKQMGVQIDRTKAGWEVSGISK